MKTLSYGGCEVPVDELLKRAEEYEAEAARTRCPVRASDYRTEAEAICRFVARNTGGSQR